MVNLRVILTIREDCALLLGICSLSRAYECIVRYICWGFCGFHYCIYVITPKDCWLLQLNSLWLQLVLSSVCATGCSDSCRDET